MRDLDDDWRRAVREAGSTAPDVEVAAARARLLDRWREPHRHYHDQEHLTDVLEAVDALAGLAADLPVVRLAAWFHDAVMQGRPGDDEEDSAALAQRELAGLGVPPTRTSQVARLIRLTTRHDPDVDDTDGQVLCDADLAILGAPADRYARYAAAVRAEYAHVPDAAFRLGRSAVLSRLASGPLYRTRTARNRWEATARANLEAELTALRG